MRKDKNFNDAVPGARRFARPKWKAAWQRANRICPTGTAIATLGNR